MNALYDASTIWPAGFDVAGQGAVARTWPEALSQVAHAPENGPRRPRAAWPHEAAERPQPAQGGWTQEPEPEPEPAHEPEPPHEPGPQQPATWAGEQGYQPEPEPEPPASWAAAEPEAEPAPQSPASGAAAEPEAEPEHDEPSSEPQAGWPSEPEQQPEPPAARAA